jgi:hypothetical protein
MGRKSIWNLADKRLKLFELIVRDGRPSEPHRIIRLCCFLFFFFFFNNNNNNQNLKFCIFIFHHNHDVNLGCKTARRGTAAPLPYLRSAHQGRASRNQYARWSLPLRPTPLLVSLRPPHYIHLNYVEPPQSRFSRTVLPTRHQHLARNLAIATYRAQGFVYHGAGLRA